MMITLYFPQMFKGTNKSIKIIPARILVYLFLNFVKTVYAQIIGTNIV